MSINIRPLEKKILATIESQATLTDKQLAKELKLKVHNVRYAIKCMKQNGLISKVPLINIGALGFDMHNIFFSIAADTQAKRQAILKTITEAAEVTWLGEFGGDYQYALGLCAQSFLDVRNFLENISEAYGKIFYEKQVSYQFNSLRFARRYLDPKRKHKTVELAYYYPTKTYDYDELDLKILVNLQDQAELSDRARAQNLGMPLSTYKLRLSKLEQHEVISGYVYIVDYQLLGVEQYKAMIYARGYSSQFRSALQHWAQEHHNVIGFVECFGAWDFELNIEVEKQEQVVLINQSLYERFGSELSLIKTLTRFRNIKMETIPRSLFTSQSR